MRRGLRVQVRIVAEARDAGEGAWEDEEAREQDPGEEGGEDVVQAWDGVEGGQHVHIACLDGVLAAELCGASGRGSGPGWFEVFAMVGGEVVMAMGYVRMGEVDVMA